MGRFRRFAAALLAIVIVGAAALAHDVPADLKVNAFVRPAGERLEVLLRVPLQGMREVDLPTRGPGYLEISAADEALRNAAKLWLAHNIEVFEDDAPVGLPEVAKVR